MHANVQYTNPVLSHKKFNSEAMRAEHEDTCRACNGCQHSSHHHCSVAYPPWDSNFALQQSFQSAAGQGEGREGCVIEPEAIFPASTCFSLICLLLLFPRINEDPSVVLYQVVQRAFESHKLVYLPPVCSCSNSCRMTSMNETEGPCRRPDKHEQVAAEVPWMFLSHRISAANLILARNF